MRHPFWTWTGWLTLGLAGCINSFDGRKVATHAVSDRDTAKPVVVGPLRKSSPSFVSNESTTKEPSVAASTSANKLKQPLLPPEAALNGAAAKPNDKTPAARRDAQVVPAQFQRPHAPAAEPALLPDIKTATPLKAVHRPLPTATSSVLPAMKLPPAPIPFAEFERAIPLKTDGSKLTLIEDKEPVLAPPAENESGLEADHSAVSDPESQALPLIIPAQQPSSKPAEPREVPAPVTSLFQERPAVTESSTAKPTAHPRDVALLVEQVFEDLRQRRLDNARERTEWLKRLVAKGANPTSAAVEAGSRAAHEPKHLEVNDAADLSHNDANLTNDLSDAVSSDDEVPLSK